jgi:branched-subunit amino acid ABC-type transport system permease component
MLFLIQDGITNGAIYALLGLALVWNLSHLATWNVADIASSSQIGVS